MAPPCTGGFPNPADARFLTHASCINLIPSLDVDDLATTTSSGGARRSAEAQGASRQRSSTGRPRAVRRSGHVARCRRAPPSHGALGHVLDRLGRCSDVEVRSISSTCSGWCAPWVLGPVRDLELLDSPTARPRAGDLRGDAYATLTCRRRRCCTRSSATRPGRRQQALGWLCHSRLPRPEWHTTTWASTRLRARHGRSGGRRRVEASPPACGSFLADLLGRSHPGSAAGSKSRADPRGAATRLDQRGSRWAIVVTDQAAGRPG